MKLAHVIHTLNAHTLRASLDRATAQDKEAYWVIVFDRQPVRATIHLEYEPDYEGN